MPTKLNVVVSFLLVKTLARFFLCFFFFHDPGAGPVWIAGARLAGIIERTTIHCYTQNMKALGLVVSEKKICFMFFSHDASGAGPVWTPGARLAGVYDHYTLLHTKTESSGLCGFGEEDFFLCFSHCMSIGPNDPQVGAIFDTRGMVGRIYKEDHYYIATYKI